MAYAERPHILATLTAVGTGTTYKIDWVNDLSGVIVASGWDPEVVTVTTGQNGSYNRTVAPVVVEITQSGEFDSFCLFGGPGPSCDGLSVWSVHVSGGDLNVGWESACEPDDDSAVKNCCFCTGNCDAGVHWGTDCGFNCNCASPGCCIAATSWTWPDADFSGQHDALVAQVREQIAISGCTTVDSVILAQSVGTATATTWIAVWCEGGTTAPLIGASELTLPNIGAAFNASVSAKHGGWVLHSQPSNTSANKITLYIGVNRFSEGPGDSIAATYPFVYAFSTYTSQTHPILYVESAAPGGTLTGKESRSLFRNDDNDMRVISDPYHVFMHSVGTDTPAITTGSENNLSAGALRQVPLNGEDPTLPATWDFTRAIFQFGGNAGTGLYEANALDANNESFYLTVNNGNQQKITTAVSVSADMGVAGFVWTLNNSTDPLEWISGEAFYSEPWSGFNSAVNSAAPILGQLWDCIVPSKVGGSGYFFWDGEWWTHWQIYRTETNSSGGPPANVGFRVGFQTLDGAEPILGVWVGLPDPRDVFLYDLLQNNILDPFPWGDVTGVTISNSTFTGGTSTHTITATCTQNVDAQDDGEKLVALHSPRNFFTFTPEIISIGSGTTTGTSLVTALSPGLGGVIVDIFANSIDQTSISVTVND